MIKDVMFPPDDWDEALSLLCLLDGAQDPQIYPRLRQAGEDAVVVPIYDGQAAADVASVAPYLAELDVDGRLLEWLLANGWGRRWGIYFWSAAPIAEIRAHFRRLTRIKTEDGRVLLFRFYDPRILGRFLNLADEQQLQSLFGPIGTYLLEVEHGAGLDRLTLEGGALRRERVDVLRGVA